MEDPGVALVFGVCNVGVDPSDLEASLNAELEKVQNELISETEFQKVRNQVENGFVLQNSTVAGIAENLSTYYLFYGNTGLVNEEIQRYMSVTREDIRAAAKKYFNANNRVSLYYLPKETTKS
jgi:predicted Zn-dependent peptidase